MVEPTPAKHGRWLGTGVVETWRPGSAEYSVMLPQLRRLVGEPGRALLDEGFSVAHANLAAAFLQELIGISDDEAVRRWCEIEPSEFYAPRPVENHESGVL